jgi:hypothetical protein
MANKKTKKKHTKRRKTGASAHHKLATKRSAKKKRAPKKKLAKKKPALKKAVAKKKAVGRRAAGAQRTGVLKRGVPAQSGSLDTEPLELQDRRSRSAGQSGDLQGLSNIESADSESVDELIEEGNAFEADVVAGVERINADSAADSGRYKNSGKVSRQKRGRLSKFCVFRR